MIKAFNNIYFKSLLENGRAKGTPDRIALPAARDRRRIVTSIHLDQPGRGRFAEEEAVIADSPHAFRGSRPPATRAASSLYNQAAALRADFDFVG